MRAQAYAGMGAERAYRALREYPQMEGFLLGVNSGTAKALDSARVSLGALHRLQLLHNVSPTLWSDFASKYFSTFMFNDISKAGNVTILQSIQDWTYLVGSADDALIAAVASSRLADCDIDRFTRFLEKATVGTLAYYAAVGLNSNQIERAIDEDIDTRLVAAAFGIES